MIFLRGSCLPRTCSLPSDSANVRTRTILLHVYLRQPICKRTSDAKVRTIRDIAACPSRKANIYNKERESSDVITLIVKAPVCVEDILRFPAALAEVIAAKGAVVADVKRRGLRNCDKNYQKGAPEKSS